MMLPLVLLSGSSCTDDDEYTQGQWIKRSGFEAEPRAYACSFTIGEKGYLCGGFRGANKEYMNDLWVYDMNNNNWEQLADMPTAGRKYATAFALNGKGYVTTGSVKDGSYSNYVADTWEYDPSSDAWTQKDDFKGGPRDGALSFVVGGYAYIATGYRSGVTADYWKYDPDQDLWYGDSDDDFTPLTDVHNNYSGASSRDGAVSFSNGERGFVLTGQSGGSYFDDVYELLPDEQEEV